MPLRQGGSGNRRQLNWLADEPPAGLLEHQGELGEAETRAVRGTRNEDAKPSSSPACRRRPGAKLGSCSRNPRATFAPAAAMNLAALSRNSVCSDVRCRSMSVIVPCVSSGRFSTRRARTLRCISDEPP